MTTYALKRKMLPALIISTMGLSLAAGMLYAAGQEGASPAAGAAERGAAAQQQNGRGTAPRAAAPKAAMMHDMRASELIGKAVVNAQGENLGEINDLIVDVNNERIHYAVLAFGGMVGVGEKLFAYPVKAFQPAVGKDQLVLNVSKESLESAPGFERQAWPDWNRDDYRASVDRHFGPAMGIEPKPNQQLVRASEMIGDDVNDMENRKAGEIEDLVVNLRSGQLPYAVIDLDTSWGAEDVLIPVSVKALEVAADGDEIQLQLPREEIDVSAGFKEDEWPDLSNPASRPKVNGQARGTG